mmetsp:Transcript_60264/g.130082  ORF Transcript_60264/g.130082 Transcript_60264/m.130082 type:complete len:222 (-) Transcript_60264:1105-1770(-)
MHAPHAPQAAVPTSQPPSPGPWPARQKLRTNPEPSKKWGNAESKCGAGEAPGLSALATPPSSEGILISWAEVVPLPCAAASATAHEAARAVAHAEAHAVRRELLRAVAREEARGVYHDTLGATWIATVLLEVGVSADAGHHRTCWKMKAHGKAAGSVAGIRRNTEAPAPREAGVRGENDSGIPAGHGGPAAAAAAARSCAPPHTLECRTPTAEPGSNHTPP